MVWLAISTKVVVVAGSACPVPLYFPHHLAVCRSVATSYLSCLLNGLDCKISGLMMILTLRQEVPSDTTTGQVGMIRKGQLTLFLAWAWCGLRYLRKWWSFAGSACPVPLYFPHHLAVCRSVATSYLSCLLNGLDCRMSGVVMILTLRQEVPSDTTTGQVGMIRKGQLTLFLAWAWCGLRYLRKWWLFAGSACLVPLYLPRHLAVCRCVVTSYYLSCLLNGFDCRMSGVMMILTLRQEVPSDTTTGQVGMIRKGQLTLFLAWAWCGLRYLRKWWLFAGSACLVPLYLPHHLAVCRSVVTSYLFCLLNGLDCKISGLMMILTLRQEVPSDTTTGQVGMIRKGQLTLFLAWAWCGLRYLRKWWLFAGSACLVPLYLPPHLAVCRCVATSYLSCLLNGLDCKISGLMMILTLRQEVPSDTTTGQVGMIRKGQLTLFLAWAWCGLRYLRKWWLFAGSACLVPLYLPHHLAVCRSVVTSYLFCLLNGLDCKISGLMMILTLRQEVPSDTTTGQVGMIRKGQLTLFLAWAWCGLQYPRKWWLFARSACVVPLCRIFIGPSSIAFG